MHAAYSPRAARTLSGMARSSDRPIPTGRVRRTARLGGLAGEQAARAAANRAANVVRTPGRREAAMERWQLQAAEQMVEVLGNMKGAAMKVGQIASFMDMPALPPEVRERMQAKLAELRDSAPRMAFEDMRKVVEADLETPLEDAFAEWNEEAIAAASIGQVYRARLHDGRDVAVKVQYPGVAQAVRVDMQNLGLILQVAKRIAPGLDAKAAAAEIRERFTEELDYEHEAQSQRAIARSWRGHPFVVIPDVVTSLSREHTLVTEYVEGIGFEKVRELPQPEQDRFGEIVFRFFFGCLYRTGLFSGDPHPGNYLLMPDGRVAFLDFGMTKKISRAQIEQEMTVIRAGLEGDAEGVRANFAARGFFDESDDRIAADHLLEHLFAVAGWYLEDRERRIEPDYVEQVLFDFGDPRSSSWQRLKHVSVPPDALLALRMEILTLGVLARLEAKANWHRIAREMFFAGPPATELGEQETAFWTR
jgi:predicted unusual protein kinase regulating ubiquinone biosynthesis (AarF/ABC1/UbiB family)